MWPVITLLSLTLRPFVCARFCFYPPTIAVLFPPWFHFFRCYNRLTNCRYCTCDKLPVRLWQSAVRYSKCTVSSLFVLCLLFTWITSSHLCYPHHTVLATILYGLGSYIDCGGATLSMVVVRRLPVGNRLHTQMCIHRT